MDVMAAQVKANSDNEMLVNKVQMLSPLLQQQLQNVNIEKVPCHLAYPPIYPPLGRSRHAKLPATDGRDDYHGQNAEQPNGPVWR